jgi:hypothetical protein
MELNHAFRCPSVLCKPARTRWPSCHVGGRQAVNNLVVRCQCYGPSSALCVLAAHVHFLFWQFGMAAACVPASRVADDAVLESTCSDARRTWVLHLHTRGYSGTWSEGPPGWGNPAQFVSTSTGKELTAHWHWLTILTSSVAHKHRMFAKV